MSTADAAAIRETEQWFVKRGLPHFISNYSASRDVLTRAVPVLTIVFLFEIANAPKESFPLWLSVVAVAGGFAILLGAWMVANGLRHRPLLARPVDIGAVEVAVFVLAPPAIPLVFGGQWRSAIATAAVNVGLLAVIYLVTSYGLVPMTRWAAGETIRELSTVAGLVGRALPLLALFVTFLFLTEEVWLITAEIEAPFYAVVLLLFPLVATTFAVIRLPREVGRLARFESGAKVCERAAATPAAPLTEGIDPPADTPGLGRRQWGNVGLVMLFSQGFQVVVVTAGVFAFLMFIGVLMVDPQITERFLENPPHVLATIDLWGRRMVVTAELLRIAGFLAVFSGFQFAISVLTDATYRDEFLEDLLEEMRRSLAVRAVYLAALSAPRVGPSTLSST